MICSRLLLLLPFYISTLSWSADFPTPTNNQKVTTPFLSPKEALAKMHLPPGFKATVFAGEPDVQQPIACCWDEKGRFWVAENYTYSDSAERFDMKLRDRILIFEDTDNDGVHDKRTVFADNLQMLTSIERGFGGVYALCPPHLLWIPTKDDKPAGPPQVLLDGFSTTAASRHTFANGLKWGPDGWLYGRVGISSTSWIDAPGTPQEKRQPTAGGIWRYHPTRKIYEPFCHGTTNPWGMDW
ncbi:MAG: PVC-type heme-binding CxxCH protein, partial [Roseimicrobium sp.]